jgi:hypothetical protein
MAGCKKERSTWDEARFREAAGRGGDRQRSRLAVFGNQQDRSTAGYGDD